jgi:hypothetical protein
LWQNDTGWRGGDRPAGGTKAGASGDDLGAPLSLLALSKSALTHHRRWLVVVWPAAIVRPPGVSFPAGIYQQTPAAACASDAAVPITGGLGAVSTNKRHRVYTEALLATTISAYK